MPGSPDLAARIGKPGNHWILYVVIAFFGGLLTFAGARAQQRATDDATFRKLIDGYCAAWSTGDPNNVAKYYAKEDGLIFYDVTPFSYSNWKEYDAGVRKALLDQAETWLALRPTGAPAPTAETERYLAESRRADTDIRLAEAKTKRRWRFAQAAIFVLLVGVILGLVGWINQAFIKEQLNWFFIMRQQARS